MPARLPLTMGAAAAAARRGLDVRTLMCSRLIYGIDLI